MSRHIETRRRLKSITSLEEFTSLVNSCVLSDEERLIIELYYLKGKPFGYIADTLGYSESWIKKKHHRIISRLGDMC